MRVEAIPAQTEHIGNHERDVVHDNRQRVVLVRPRRLLLQNERHLRRVRHGKMQEASEGQGARVLEIVGGIRAHEAQGLPALAGRLERFSRQQRRPQVQQQVIGGPFTGEKIAQCDHRGRFYGRWTTLDATLEAACTAQVHLYAFPSRFPRCLEHADARHRRLSRPATKLLRRFRIERLEERHGEAHQCSGDRDLAAAVLPLWSADAAPPPQTPPVRDEQET
eukprot:scaffold300_cov258-Pinguiococcus_pyrenoidosus.AAC.61